ncbi:DUF3131 domain-containing protein [Desulfonema ishimotonii]|uniref:DUF3131 domain-containing protein n=1 Tax=Desulfonema ishimotonii TaxID=45657 RepID=A0A401FUL8_9BACT|nr:DUF3131 domain-containing protein [Desulfonema ishimotonii]GBC60644.1 DUF3131 domain-containing protein [Desulfonema ishimotonii]
MTFKEGLISARSHIIFLLGVIAAFGLIYTLEKWDVQKKIEKQIREGLTIDLTADIPIAAPRPLTPEEEKWARIAWKYFENNFQPETGLVNSVDGFPASTMWDTASYLMALISARRLEIIDEPTFHSRLSMALRALTAIPLFEGKLPNKSYSTATGGMTNYKNRKTDRGIGWSAIDIGRLLAPLSIIVWNYPEHAKAVKSVIIRWELGALIRNGVLYGGLVNDEGRTVYVQEGRMGYEEYAAKAFYLMGMDVYRALRYMDFLKFIDIYGIRVPCDLRDPETYGAHNYVLSEPYILDGIEFGWDEASREFAFRVYRAQEERYNNTGILTAVTEGHLDRAPYFVYNTVFTDGKPWNCISTQGDDASQFKTLSIKAAFGWHALYKTEYTRKLIEKIKGLNDPDRGWYSGLYETPEIPNKTITGNTNAIILECLCYIKLGKHVTLYD